MILGITGGSGCGKTTLLELLRQHGAMVLDCDAIYHELLEQDLRLLDQIETHFPGTTADGHLLRKKLGAIVFSNPAALQKLNAITHRAVKAEVQRRLAKKPALAAVDAIGLFEGDLAALCDITVAVTAPEEMRLARLMARDGISSDYAAARIHAQPEDSVFAARCDYVLKNNGTPEAFCRDCLAFFQIVGII